MAIRVKALVLILLRWLIRYYWYSWTGTITYLYEQDGCIIMVDSYTLCVHAACTDQIRSAPLLGLASTLTNRVRRTPRKCLCVIKLTIEMIEESMITPTLELFGRLADILFVLFPFQVNSYDPQNANRWVGRALQNGLTEIISSRCTRLHQRIVSNDFPFTRAAFTSLHRLRFLYEQNNLVYYPKAASN